jgi:hypothetical protein
MDVVPLCLDMSKIYLDIAKIQGGFQHFCARRGERWAGSVYDAFARIGLAARVATSRAIAATVAVMYVWLSRDRRRRSRLRQRRIADVEQAHLAFAEFARDRRNRDRVPLRIIATVVEMDELV